MIKKSLIVASLLFATTNVLAVDAKNFYVGMGMVSGSGEFSADFGSADYDSSSLPLKIGYMTKSDNRVEFSLDSSEHEFRGYTGDVSGWNLDWNFTYPEHKLGDVVTPYWTIGFGSYDFEDEVKGNSINYGIGALYDINKNIEVEASYKFKTISWDEDNADSKETAMYLGLNYKF